MHERVACPLAVAGGGPAHAAALPNTISEPTATGISTCLATFMRLMKTPLKEPTSTYAGASGRWCWAIVAAFHRRCTRTVHQGPGVGLLCVCVREREWVCERECVCVGVCGGSHQREGVGVRAIAQLAVLSADLPLRIRQQHLMHAPLPHDCCCAGWSCGGGPCQPSCGVEQEGEWPAVGQWELLPLPAVVGPREADRLPSG